MTHLEVFETNETGRNKMFYHFGPNFCIWPRCWERPKRGTFCVVHFYHYRHYKKYKEIRFSGWRTEEETLELREAVAVVKYLLTGEISANY